MPGLGPVSWQKLVCVFEKDGFAVTRQRGSHIIMTKEGVARPLVIPQYKELGDDIIRSNMRTAGMSRGKFFELLNQC